MADTSVGLDGIAGLWMNWLEKATYIAPGGGKGGHEVRRLETAIRHSII